MTKLTAVFDKKVSIILSAIIIVASLLIALPLSADAWDGTSAQSFHSGNGTKDNPYTIETAEELGYFYELLSQGVTFDGVYLSLQADIDISNVAVNTSSTKFNGEFNGNGHTITTKSRFLYTIEKNGKVFLLNVVVPDSITIYTEILCYTNNGTIEGCVVSGNIKGDDNFLGFMCHNNYGTISNSGAIGNISGRNVYAGGFVNYNYGTINNVYSAVSTQGVYESGRYGSSREDSIAVENFGSSITNAYYGLNSSKHGIFVSNETMLTQEFVNILNETNPCIQSSWSYNEGGYPKAVSDSKIKASCQLEFSEDEIFTYSTNTLVTKILVTNYLSCDIYYTLDGSNPAESNTRILYDGSSLELTGNGTISTVPYKDGAYGQIFKQRYIKVRGEGTGQSPILIGSKEDLCAMYINPNAYFSLECDLIFEETDFALGGVCEGGWTPIKSFGGVFDGNGYAIANLEGEHGGFISSNKGTITSVRFLNCQLRYGDAYSSWDRPSFGSVADYNSGTVTRCYVERSVSTYGQNIGGIVGSNLTGTVSYCATDGTISAKGPDDMYYSTSVGGIVGSGDVYSCYNRAKVYFRSSVWIMTLYIGGITSDGDVVDCRNDGNISASCGTYSEGGVANGTFTAYYSRAENCYSHNVCYSGPDVSGYWVSGGNATHYNCYSFISSENSWKESSYPEFDFTEKWMIVDGEPVPQGVMNADGKCYTKLSYYEGLNENGVYIGISKYVDQYGTVYTETYPDHICTPSSDEWFSNQSEHYHLCSCGEACDVSEHVRNSNDENCAVSACVYCGFEMSAIEEHTEVIDKALAPTCTETGLTGGKHCSACGEILVAQDIVSALGHSYTTEGDCSLCGEYRATFSGASLTLEDNIAVNFKVSPEQFDGTGYTSPYVVFTFNGSEFVVTDYTFDSKGRFAFTFSDIAPRMMNDSIVATLYATFEGEIVACQTRSYSVKEYCYNMLSRCSEGGAYANNESFKALLVDLLNYGEAAQIYGSYNVDNLVTKDLTDEQKAWATSSSPTVSTVQNLTYRTIKNPTVTWKAGGLLLEDAVTMRFKFSTTSIEGITVKFYTDSNPTGWVVGADELVETSGGYYVYFDGLKARQMRETVYITVYRGDTAISNTVSYSIESYAYAKQNDSNAKLTALLEAMMKYGDSAYRYINK